MKEEPVSIDKLFPMSSMYLDDIVEIARLIEGEVGSAKIRIKYDEKEYSVDSSADIDQFRDLKLHHVFDVCLTGHGGDNYFYVYFDSYTCAVRIDKGTTVAYGLLNKISKIIKKRQRSIAFPFATTGTLVESGIIAFILILIVAYLTRQNSTIYFLIGLGFAIVLEMAVSIYVGKQYTITYLNYSYNRSSFLTRNKDRILVGLICTILGGIGVLIIQKILF